MEILDRIDIKKVFWIICLLTLMIRFPGTMYGMQPNDPDFKFIQYDYGEMVFADMTPQFMDGKVQEEDFYPKGLSFEMAIGASVLKLFFPNIGPHKIVVIGRMLSLTYGALTVGVLFLLLFQISVDIRLALISAILMIFMPRLILTSDFASADSGVLFWVCTTMYSSLMYLKCKKHRYFFLIVLSSGLSLSFKFAYIVFIPLIYIFVKERWPMKKILLVMLVLYLVFYIGNGGKYTWNNFALTINNVLTDNVGGRQYNKLLNYISYFIFAFIELTLPIFLLSIWGIVQSIRGKFPARGGFPARDIIFIILVPLGFQLITAFSLIYADGRQILFLYPFLIVMGVFGFLDIKRRLTGKAVLVANGAMVVVMVYYALLAAGLLHNMLFDNRKLAAVWIDKNIPAGESLSLSPSVTMPSIYRGGYKLCKNLSEGHYLVLHQDYYIRYIRSNENPLTQYPKWEEIFHPDREGFLLCQGIFKGELPYTLVKRFPARFRSFEMQLIDKFMGSMDGIGEVLIYRKDVQIPSDSVPFPKKAGF